MVKARKWIGVFLCITFALCLITCAAGCDDKDKKYDGSMRIVCSQLIDGERVGRFGEYVFTPDIEEMHIEREYDGNEYVYYLEKYNLPDHPELRYEWLEPGFGGANVFTSYLNWVHVYLPADEAPKTVCEKGEYLFSVAASSTSNIWNYRNIDLYITVK